MNRNVLVSLSLAIILISVSTVSAVIVESPATEQNNSTASEMTIEEFNNLRNEYAKEVESSMGISYEEYCNELEALNGKIVYIHFNDDNSIAVDIVDTIDKGRSAVDYVSSYGYNVYIDSVLCGALSSMGAAAAIALLVSSLGAGILLSGIIGGLIVWINENNGWENGIIVEVHCWREYIVWGCSIKIGLPQNMWTYNMRGQ